MEARVYREPGVILTGIGAYSYNRLGFGLMRLPKNPDGSIDIPQVAEMADRFLAAGGTYFDTAYVYDSGGSEEAFKAAVADRYPRESYTVATKLNAWLGSPYEQAPRSSSPPAWSAPARAISTTTCCTPSSATTSRCMTSTASGTS